jgi:hypothetical protein
VALWLGAVLAWQLGQGYCCGQILTQRCYVFDKPLDVERMVGRGGDGLWLLAVAAFVFEGEVGDGLFLVAVRDDGRNRTVFILAGLLVKG